MPLHCPDSRRQSLAASCYNFISRRHFHVERRYGRRRVVLNGRDEVMDCERPTKSDKMASEVLHVAQDFTGYNIPQAKVKRGSLAPGEPHLNRQKCIASRRARIRKDLNDGAEPTGFKLEGLQSASRLFHSTCKEIFVYQSDHHHWYHHLKISFLIPTKLFRFSRFATSHHLPSRRLVLFPKRTLMFLDDKTSAALLQPTAFP